ncbi:TM0106 family RecB-like putative nuclease [Gammaproteobacteria bacterium]|nr:TM0106 family RecB-like putative nuclease [Gammaproteobacteria bacterium]
MSETKNYPFIKPSDATAWSKCVRRVWLDNKGQLDCDQTEDPFDQLVKDRGLEHEEKILKHLQGKYDVHKASSIEETHQLMAQNVEVIYQAQLRNDKEGFVGFPDFLILNESGEYQPADAKLSLNAKKKSIQIQLGFYRKLLGVELPAIVYLGDDSTAEIGDEANAITEKFINEMRILLKDKKEPSARYSHSKCSSCSYYNHCKPKFEAAEELSLIYGIQGRSAQGLEKIGVKSITELANTDYDTLPDVPYLKGSLKKKRAVLQAQSYLSHKIYTIAPISLPQGTWVHFDIEDNALTTNIDKHVYLWGFLEPSNGDNKFEYVWTDREEDDEIGWMAFLDKIEEYRFRYSDLILAHFSQHERTTILAYAKRYSMEENETVKYLLGNDSPFFDMQKPVLESLVLPLQSYGLKDICKHRDLVNFQWEDAGTGGQWSIVQFNRYLKEKDTKVKEQLKKEILGYNHDDVIATFRLEEWLRSRVNHKN